MLKILENVNALNWLQKYSFSYYGQSPLFTNKGDFGSIEQNILKRKIDINIKIVFINIVTLIDGAKFGYKHWLYVTTKI